MDFRELALAAAAVAALSPAIAAADNTDAALSACVHAFAARITAPGAEAPAVKIAYPRSHSVNSFTDYDKHNYTFTMSARKVHGRTEYARATCLADANGSVLAFHTENLDEAKTLAAR